MKHETMQELKKGMTENIKILKKASENYKIMACGAVLFLFFQPNLDIYSAAKKVGGKLL